ncbi:hypothetical protein MP228_005369 [Amoeboaphelidium protococcarum]|nr:hypothetical protein MP228_005369 [Amoeboaphelidium protococcarum]
MNKVKRKLKEWSIDSKTVELDMSYSELKKVPGVIRKLKHLTKLHLNGNNIKQIEPEAFEISSSVQKSTDSIATSVGVEHIDLSGNKLQTLPESFGLGCLKRTLTYLDLSYNQIQTLPDAALYELTALQYLDLSHNGLSQLVDRIGKLQSLQILKVTNNNLTYVAADIITLQSLKELHLQNNQLSLLSHKFTDMVSLHLINLSGNKFTELPKCLANLPHTVQYIDLSRNQITSLDDKIVIGIAASTQYLKVLDLRDNQIQSLPDALSRLAMVDRIVLLGNGDLIVKNDHQLNKKWPNTVRNMTNIEFEWTECKMSTRSDPGLNVSTAIDQKQQQQQKQQDLQIRSVRKKSPVRDGRKLMGDIDFTGKRDLTSNESLNQPQKKRHEFGI